MQAITEKVVNMVREANGETTYPALYEALPVEERAALPKALREAKAEGVLRQFIEPVDGKNVHKVLLVEGAS